MEERPSSRRPATRARLAVALLAVATGAALLPASPLHARSPERVPTLRLLAPTAETATTRDAGEPVYVEPGSFVAAVDGPFELRLRRTSRDYEVAQVVPDRGGQVRTVRTLPAWTVGRRPTGLRGFFTVQILDESGTQVARRKLPLCVEGERARVDDSGPDTVRYPLSCWTSEMTEGTVWGLEEGWAVRAPYGAPFTLADGTYTVRLSISESYVELLGIDPATATGTLRLTVTTSEDSPPPCDHPHCLEARGGDTHGWGSHAGPGTPPEVAPGAGGLPDLVALPAWRATARHDEETGRDVVEFAATVWNAGPGPLVVEGFRRGSSELMDAYQYLYEGGRRTTRLPAGTLEFDTRDGHDHWHFTDFARYRLLDGANQVAVRSQKEAFCLAPTDAVDLTVPGANWHPGSTGLGTACGGPGAIWIREVLDAGWGDTYVQSLPGQSFDVTDLANGTYVIEVTTNPDGRLSERSSANNVAHTTVELGGTPGARTVTVR